MNRSHRSTSASVRLAATLVVLCAFVLQANSAVVVSEQLQGVGFGGTAASIDFNQDGIAEVLFSHDGLTAYALSNNGARLQAVPATPPNIGSWAAPILAGQTIGQTPTSGSSWIVEVFGSAIYGSASTGTGTGASYGLWPASEAVYLDPVNFYFLPVTTAYLGVQFEVQAQTHFGWIEIGVIKDLPNAYVLRSAWESDPNTPIIASSVPEPIRTLMGAAGVFVLWHRRRRAALGAG